MSEGNGKPDKDELAALFADADPVREQRKKDCYDMLDYGKNVVIRLDGFRPGPAGSFVIRDDTPPAGDCTKCGFVKALNCDGEGSVSVGHMGFRQCPHAAVAELLGRK